MPTLNWIGKDAVLEHHQEVPFHLLLSLADLRCRVVPGVEIVFLGVVLVALPDNPWAVCAVVLAVGWGWMPVQRFSGGRTWPNALALPLLFYPPAWPVLLTGSGVRQGLVGRGDLLAAGSLALVFPWPALIPALIGLEVWQRWWVKHNHASFPALPGMVLGMVLYLCFERISNGVLA